MESVHKRHSVISIGSDFEIRPKLINRKLRVIFTRKPSSKEGSCDKATSICLYLKQYGHFRTWFGPDLDFEYKTAQKESCGSFKPVVITKDLGYDGVSTFDGATFTLANKFASFSLSANERAALSDKDEEIEQAIATCKELLSEMSSQ